MLGWQHLRDALLAVAEADLNAEFLVEVLGQMLRAIDTAVLAARAAEGEHEAGESALQIACHVCVGQGIDALEEGEDFAIVLEEFYHGGIQSRQLLVGLVAAWVVRAAAVEHVASAVAALVGGDALLVAEAEDAHDEGGGLFDRDGRRLGCGCGRTFGALGRRIEAVEVDQLLERLFQVGIGCADTVEQEAAEVLDGCGNTIQEILLALKIATQAIGTEHLERAEDHEELEVAAEALGVNGGKRLEFEEVSLYHFFAQGVGIARGGLPEEGGHVVVQRTALSALEVYEMGKAIGINHHVARLEVAEEEGGLRAFGSDEVGRHGAEVAFEFHLIVGRVGGAEEAVFEVVEVEHGRLHVKLPRLQQLGEIERGRPFYLDMGQEGHSAADEFALVRVVLAACLAPAAEGVVEGDAAEVALEIAAAVFATGVNLGHGQTARREMAAQIDEAAVFGHVGSYHTDAGAVVGGAETDILAVAASLGQAFGGHGVGTFPLLIELKESLHEDGVCFS